MTAHYIRAKNLRGEQAVAALLIRGLPGSTDAARKNFDVAKSLVAHNIPAINVSQLTGVGRKIIIALAKTDAINKKAAAGQKPKLIGTIFATPEIHLRASYFVSSIARSLRDTGTELDGHAILQGIIATREVFGEWSCSKFSERHFLMAVEYYQSGKLRLSRCGVCSVEFLVMNKPDTVNDGIFSAGGSCPCCKYLKKVKNQINDCEQHNLSFQSE